MARYDDEKYDMENAPSAPSPREMGADLANRERLNEIFRVYPGRAFTEAGEVTSLGNLVIEERLMKQTLALTRLEQKLMELGLPRYKKEKNKDRTAVAWSVLEKNLMQFLAKLAPYPEYYNDDLEEQGSPYTTSKQEVVELRRVLRRTLYYALFSTGYDSLLQPYIEQDELCIKHFRPDILLTFFSHVAVREKIAELLGHWWLQHQAVHVAQHSNLSREHFLEQGILRSVTDAIHDAVLATVERARSIPRLAKMVHLDTADQMLLKKNMACMGDAKGMYLVLLRPLEEEAHVEFIEKDGMLLGKSIAKQPDFVDPCTYKRVGEISLTNLTKKSSIVAHVPIGQIDQFSLEDVLSDFAERSYLLKDLQAYVVMIDTHNTASDDDDFLDLDDQFLESTGDLAHDELNEDDDEIDEEALYELFLAQEQSSLPEVPTHFEKRFGECLWWKQLKAAQCKLSVKELDIREMYGKSVVVDMEKHAIFLNDPKAPVPLSLISSLDDIVSFSCNYPEAE